MLLAVLAFVVAGCAKSSPIGTVDVQRIISNWTAFQSDQNQLYADEQKITVTKASQPQKAKEIAALEQKYGAITIQLTNQLRDAAKKIALQKGLTLVVTRAGVGYGGVDITPDVEKVLGVTEKPTPSPSP